MVALDIQIPLTLRLIETGFRLLWYGLVLWIGLLFLLQEWLLPNWSPPERADLSAAIAIPLAAVLAGLAFYRKYYRIVISDRIELRRLNSVTTIQPSEICGMVGLGGANIDGGEMIVWKHIMIVTAENTYRLSFGYEHNPLCYEAIRQVAARAWCLPFCGVLEQPIEMDSYDNSELMLSIERMRKVFRSSIIRSTMGGVAFVSGAIAIGAGLYFAPEFAKAQAMAVVWLIVAFIIGMLLFAGSVRDLKTLAKIRRTQRRLIEKGDILL